ncbi:unnamed protein product [Cylicocyclus nassatus]|uniref:Collagenase NC10/endostatin domain-containing protein n=1 Tax=Cylicocyclus nassatus TaxID=53992 RepID=A0AA36DTJ7_CYLNA|nr:unnamed protein product [Cylicocyclus nassatus]
MKEVTSIDLQQIKNIQNAIDSMRPSSDSVVRTLAGIIKEQSNIIAGLVLAIRLIALNNPYDGNMRAIHGADLQCYREARMVGFTTTFREMLTMCRTDFVHIADWDTPVVNIHDELCNEVEAKFKTIISTEHELLPSVKL